MLHGLGAPTGLGDLDARFFWRFGAVVGDRDDGESGLPSTAVEARPPGETHRVHARAESPQFVGKVRQSARGTSSVALHADLAVGARQNRREL
jgi:hypothetical protein